MVQPLAASDADPLYGGKTPQNLIRPLAEIAFEPSWPNTQMKADERSKGLKSD